MMQKSNEEIYKALSEAERNLAEKNVGWMEKAHIAQLRMQAQHCS